MYPHFIEVHDGEDQQNLITVNIETICNFHVDDDGHTVVEIIGGEYYYVAETYDEMNTLLKKSGCQIDKGDPRLDNKPLSMNDLKDMIGEPVWNSNNRHWALVQSVLIKPQIAFVDLIEAHDAYSFDEDELIKYPLYRMRNV